MKYKSLPHTIEILERAAWMLAGKLHIVKAAFKGVHLGKNADFVGSCHFRRYPGTSIIIGSGCTFLSRPTANLIGINRPCMISTMNSPFQAAITIGDNCGFSGTVIGAFKNITLGNNVRCGANTLITDSDWHLDDPRSGSPADVVIEDNVWLGVNCVVLKGVRIGKNSVIGANSVVTKDIPANVIAGGNPCKVIKPLTI